MKRADFKQNACIEDIEYHTDRKLDKVQITRLSTCNYIYNKHNIIIMGASGSGKTYLSCAFGIQACRNYFTVKYIRLPELLTDLAIARGDGSYKKIIRKYKKVSLLILDEWLLAPLSNTEARDLLEIIESRHKNASTIFCSQFSPEGWYMKIGEGTIADAILDRIVHDSYQILIDGEESMRNEKGYFCSYWLEYGSHFYKWLPYNGTMAHELPERRLYFIVICKHSLSNKSA